MCRRIYGDRFTHSIQPSEFIDFRIGIKYPNFTRRFLKPQVQFSSEGLVPFTPLPADYAFAMLEWGMNWTVAMYEFQRVIIHSAVLAKDDYAILLPAPPGSGKSTATAYLENNGWRLLSDEMALITKNTTQVTPFVRPICLKNASIDLCKQMFSHGTFSETAYKTHKGDVAHMSPQRHSIEEQSTPANIVGIVFPQYSKDILLDIYPMDKTSAMVKFSENSFNFNFLGQQSFETNVHLIENTRQFELHYSDLSEVNAFLNEEFCK